MKQETEDVIRSPYPVLGVPNAELVLSNRAWNLVKKDILSDKKTIEEIDEWLMAHDFTHESDEESELGHLATEKIVRELAKHTKYFDLFVGEVRYRILKERQQCLR